MRVAVIGCGSIGTRHARNLTALGCEVGPFDWAEQDGVRPVADLDMGQWDAVVIATPYDWHLPYVERAIVARVPFFVEKPLGSFDQLPRWREIAAMDLPVNQVGYNWRFHPQVRQWAIQVRRLLEPTRRILFECATDMALWPGRAYGDPLLECSHDIDLALWLGARQCSDARYLDDEPGCSLEFGPRYSVLLLWGRAEPHRCYSTYLPCRDLLERGRCCCPSHKYLPLKITDSIMLDLSYRHEMQHFLECVRDDTPTETPLADGLRVLEVCAQVEQMAKHPCS